MPHDEQLQQTVDQLQIKFNDANVQVQLKGSNTRFPYLPIASARLLQFSTK